MPICTQCKKEKSSADFHKRARSANGLCPSCKDCRSAKFKEKYTPEERKRRYEHRRALPDNVKADRAYRMKQWRNLTKREKRDQNYRSAYGITVEDYDELLKKQNGVCAICLTHKCANPRIEYLSVDHCHATGKIRGLLCSECNLVLGKFKDDALRLRRAAAYLDRNRNAP